MRLTATTLVAERASRQVLERAPSPPAPPAPPAPPPPQRPAPAAAPEQVTTAGRGWGLPLVVLIIGMFMSILDTSVYVTARVPEADMHDVRPGAPVDVLSDADPDSPMTASVSQISGAAAGVNELSDRPDADPLDLDHPIYPDPQIDPQNPQQVDQYVPVRIQLNPADGARIRPGQNVVVHIHRR